MNTSFFGYPGSVWSTCWLSMSWLAGVLQSTDSQSSSSAATVVYQTLLNGIASIDAWQTGIALQAEFQNLSAVEALPLFLDPDTQFFLTNRINSLAIAATGISALPQQPNILTVVSTLEQGIPPVAYPYYVEYCMNFAAETPPSDLDSSNLVAKAQASADAWLTIVNAINVLQGGPVSQTYDTALRMWRASQATATRLASLTSGPFAYFNSATLKPLTSFTGASFTTFEGAILLAFGEIPTEQVYVWNQVVALPSILLDASMVLGAPSSLQVQQSGVIRYILSTAAMQLATYLLSLRRPQLSNVSTAPVLQDDSLQDFAARNLGNFEEWTNIAALNGLQPPYPGPTVPGYMGRQLLLPQAQQDINPNAPIPSYEANILGIDYDFGPVNGVMPQWTGDYSTIIGYANFARALGRRLQTTVGELLYHTSYGSRIPPEVGAVQSSDEAPRIAQFGKTALTQDPRTGTVLSAVATTQPGFLVTFTGVVQPVGPGSTPVTLAETIAPPS